MDEVRSLKKRSGGSSGQEVIDRVSPVPLYHQLALHLTDSVRGGEYKVNDKFPTDLELSQRFEVSRPTVRQALNELIKQGLLVRERGRGTFVRPSAFTPVAQEKVVKYHRIGLVMPWQAGTLFAPLLEAVEDVAHERGFHILLANNREDANVEIARVREMLNHGVDGVLWMCPSAGPNEAMARNLVDSVPVVVAVDRAVRIEGIRMSLVEADNVGGMRKMVEHLLGRGYQRIAFVREPQRVTSVQEREIGYNEALKSGGVGPGEGWYFSSRKRFGENGRICAGKILRSEVKFDAVVCCTDATAVGLIEVLKEKSVKVPGDVAVTGFNDDPMTEVNDPKITSAHIDIGQMGRRGMEILLAQLNALERGEAVRPVQEVIPVNLKVRESS